MFAMANANFGASEETIMQLMELGYEREQVERAMRAAFNNPDRAAEYLMTGIPEDEPMPEGDDGGAEMPGMAPPAAPAGGAPAPGGGAPAPGGGQPANAAAIQAALQAAMAQQQAGQAAGPLDFLRTNPQFAIMRQMVQQNPQMLQPLLQRLAESNPDLIRIINENQQEFARLINEPAGPMPAGMPGAGGDPMAMAGGGGGGGGGPPVLQITQEEKEAIDRLVAMGFDRNAALQAYMACEKNEEMAANLLLSDFD